MILCPDCGHEVSTAATACPNCGRPFAKPVIERKVVVAEVPRKEGIPTWVFAVLGILGVLVLFVLFVALGRNNDDDANRSVNVSLAANRSADAARDTTSSRAATDSQTLTVPPSTGSQSITVPSTSAPSSVTTVPPPSSSSSTITTVPETPTTGTVVIDAKVATRTGSPQAVRNEKFYLLDKDLESILSEADIEPIEGQTLTNSLGLAVLYPSRYGEFNGKAMNAIKRHIKYNTLTDSGGKGQMKSIKPDSYYLFGITKGRNGFAVWSSPVTIQAGENVLNLSPQRMTEIEQAPQE
jgi:type II secretory pathway pseudopilin PulG